MEGLLPLLIAVGASIALSLLKKKPAPPGESDRLPQDSPWDDLLREIQRKETAQAEVEQNIQGRIIQHIGSALDLAPGLGIFDLIFIDGDKREYPQYYEMAMRSLVHSGSYLLADNILWYGKVAEQTPAGDRFTEGIKQFNRMVTEDDRVENVILPLRDGLNLIRVK